MSRSIHTTKRELYEAWRSDYADAEHRTAELTRLKDSTDKKHRIKESVRTQRNVQSPIVISTPELIPIRVSGESEYVHYPASASDVIAVLQRLPKGVLDGLNAIDLSLGKTQMKKDRDKEYFDETSEPDPYTERYGIEYFPGVYLGPTLGIFYTETSRLSIFAYVYSPDLPDKEIWELYLRSKMLYTLMHEIGHHYDHTERADVRGKWRADSLEKRESYAEDRAVVWFKSYALPHLKSTYPEPIAGLENWIQQYGGISLPLSSLFEAPRAIDKGLYTMHDGTFGLEQAVVNLADEVYAGTSLELCRIDFAWDLWHAAYLSEAHQVLDQITAPYLNECCLELRAQILVSEQRYKEAKSIADQLFERNSNNQFALLALTRIYELKQDWPQLAHSAGRLCSLWKHGGSTWLYGLANHARALMHLNDTVGFEADLKALADLKDARVFKLIDDLRSAQNDNDPWLESLSK